MNRPELQAMAEHELARQQKFRLRFLCCASTPCLSSGATAVLEALKGAIESRSLQADLEAVSTGCMGPCSRGPLVTVRAREQEDVIYERVTPEMTSEIVDTFASATSAPPFPEKILTPDWPFFAKQRKIVLANSGYMNPERLEDYVALGGYSDLAHAIREMSPEEVCEEISRSGLRGRGGAGYPTGLKWHLVRKAPGERKVVVANGDEGDPGAYMDRTLMESDPHRILEGMAIAGYAVGAEQGYIYVRGEYPVAASATAAGNKSGRTPRIARQSGYGQ